MKIIATPRRRMTNNMVLNSWCSTLKWAGFLESWERSLVKQPICAYIVCQIQLRTFCQVGMALCLHRSYVSFIHNLFKDYFERLKVDPEIWDRQSQRKRSSLHCHPLFPLSGVLNGWKGSKSEIQFNADACMSLVKVWAMYQ